MPGESKDQFGLIGNSTELQVMRHERVVDSCRKIGFTFVPVIETILARNSFSDFALDPEITRKFQEMLDRIEIKNKQSRNETSRASKSEIQNAESDIETLVPYNILIKLSYMVVNSKSPRKDWSLYRKIGIFIEDCRILISKFEKKPAKIFRRDRMSLFNLLKFLEALENL